MPCRSREQTSQSPVAADLPQPPAPSEKLVEEVAEYTSALTSQESEAFLLEEKSLDESMPQAVSNNTIDHSLPSSVQSYSAFSRPTIWIRRPQDLYHVFCIRLDGEGYFHMYPDLGGPFQSLQSAEDAINHYIDGLPRPARCDGPHNFTSTESQIRLMVFYADGTPKRGPNSPGYKDPNYIQRCLVRLILDKFNDDHNLFGGCEHELDGDVKFNLFYEDDIFYYHFNFMTKIKDTTEGGNLFFAELSQTKIHGDSVISCCCIIEDNNLGPSIFESTCFGCTREGSIEIKHPSDIAAYTGGHIYCTDLTFGGDPCDDSDDDEETQVFKLWNFLEDRHAPFVREKIINWK